MSKSRRTEMPQTSISGATGSIFDPRNAQTGQAIPCDGRCSCGSTRNKVVKTGNTSERICLDCETTISAVEHGKFAK